MKIRPLYRTWHDIYNELVAAYKSEDWLRKAAHYEWEREGRPEGRSDKHWLIANLIAEMLAETDASTIYAAHCAFKPIEKQITIRKTTADVFKPNAEPYTCVFGDFETFLAIGRIYQNNEVHYFGESETLVPRITVGYIQLDGTIIMPRRCDPRESYLD